MKTTARKIVFNLDLLKKTAMRDACIIDYDAIADQKVNRESRIKFKCGECGEDGEKKLRMMYVNGCFCKVCNAMKKIEKRKLTNFERYGVEHTFQRADVRTKTKATNLERYGVEHPQKCSEVREKAKTTNLERYGVENPFQSLEVQEKIKATNLERCGYEYSSQSPETKYKIQKTNLERYGFEFPSQRPDVRAKCVQTSLERYGVEHPMQDAKIAERASKAAYNLKDFTYPCGTTIKVQGYEPFALKYLVEQGYACQDITTKRTDVPEIWYVKGERPARYFCDIFIAKDNRIIEVKSTWTYEKDKDDLVLKERACVDAGYAFELYVYDAKGLMSSTPDKMKAFLLSVS